MNELSDDQKRQLIDSTQTFSLLMNAEKRFSSYRGSMYWQKAKGYEYLIRDKGPYDRKSLGPRSSKTEEIYTAFIEKRKAATERLDALKTACEIKSRLNAALHVGRTPSIVIEILNVLRRSGLDSHVLVIGTNALFAYETNAGVYLDSGLLATEDIDVLWDSRQTLEFIVDETFKTQGFLGVLREADKTFDLEEGGYRASNKNGYIVDLIKRRPKSLYDDKEPQQMFKSESDFWAAKIYSMDWLLSSPKFEQIVVGANGHMANMITIDPRAFVLYKTWLSQKEDRNTLKKSRDLAQARAVYTLLQDRMQHLALEKINVFPEHIKQLTRETHEHVAVDEGHRAKKNS
jgi:hypothetical protein